MDEEKHNDKKTKAKSPAGFSHIVYIIFFLCMLGASSVYAFRMFFDIPIHPTFLPIIGAVFAGTLAFTLVLSFEYYIGPIEINLGGDKGFSGAGGPIILWCICFLVIVFGLYLLGISEAMKIELKEKDYKPCSVLKLVEGGDCSNKFTHTSPGG